MTAAPRTPPRRSSGYPARSTALAQVPAVASQDGAVGEVTAGRTGRNDSKTFTTVPAMLHQIIPPHSRIHPITDNGPSHATRARLAARPWSAVTCTLKHASWLNTAQP